MLYFKICIEIVRSGDPIYLSGTRLGTGSIASNPDPYPPFKAFATAIADFPDGHRS